MDIEGFWERVNTLIKSRKTTQRAISKGCGFKERRIETLVTRKLPPDVAEAALIAQALGTSVEYLLFDKDKTGYAPEIMDIAWKIAALSPEDRQDILDFINIKLKKYSKQEKKNMETFTVNEPEPAYLTETTSIPIREEVIDSVIFLEWGVIEIPLVGKTAAGQPIDFGDIDPNPPTRPWAASLIRGNPENYYCVAVRGESMTEADIKDGDHALLLHTQIPKHGEIMLVRYDNSSTLKRIKIMGNKETGREEIYICWEDGSRKRVKLDKEGYEIQGLLVAIERKPRKG